MIPHDIPSDRAPGAGPGGAERWRGLPEFGGRYEVSNMGRVRALTRQAASGGKRYGYPRGPLLLKVTPNTDGYASVRLTLPNGRFRRSVHRMALRAFCGEPPAGMEACHKNGIRMDARLSNLYWGTPVANAADCIRHGNRPRGEGHASAKLTEAAVLEIRAARRDKTATRGQLGERFGVTATAIDAVVQRLVWRHV